jgi:protein tyrosine phosphatase (PTP) superfamily phosphohydrolase (DUF442 family)
MLSDIVNYVELSDGVGTSGQPTSEQFAEIAAHGYNALINLALPTSDHAIAEEGSLVTALGMAYFHIPVRFDRPTTDDLKLFIHTMRALEGRKVWVHCVVNARVSAFMYHYLKHDKNCDEAAASSPLLTAWRPRMDPVWQSFMTLTKDEIGL